MNRKHNTAVALVALAMLICSGCAAEAAEAKKAPDRFTYEHAGKAPGGDNFYIVTDTETGVQYLLADVYNGAGLTVLQPGEGQP